MRAGPVGLFGTVLANRASDACCVKMQRLLISTWPTQLEGAWAVVKTSKKGIDLEVVFGGICLRTPRSSMSGE